MASETQEEKKPDEETPVDEEGQSTLEENAQSKEEAEEEEKPSDLSGKDVSHEVEEEEPAEDEMASKEKAREVKNVKGSRKRTSNKDTEESKEPPEESTEKEKKRRKSSGPLEHVTPVERPMRERKTVERYSASSSDRASAPKGLSIEKGRGTKLRDIPNVAFKLSKKKPDENLQMLHAILFGKKAKAHNLKRNIGQFSGFVWAENEQKQRAKLKEKLDKCFKGKLLDFCDVLDITVSKTTVKKEELTVKLLEFLESPAATTDVLLSDREQSQKGKKHKRKTMLGPEKTSAQGSSERLAKKQKHGLDARKKQKHKAKSDEDVEDEAEPAGSEDGSEEDDDKQEDDLGVSVSEEEEDEHKGQIIGKKDPAKKNAKKGSEAKGSDNSTPVKKGTPAKSVKSFSGSGSKKGASIDDKVSRSISKSKGSMTKGKKLEKERQKGQSPSARDKPLGSKQAGKSGLKASTKEKGKSKVSAKARVEPSREDMHAAVVNILKEVDFNTATLSDILRELGMHFGVDLMHRKAEVKSIITDVINSMTDEEDDGDEAGDDEEAGEDMDEKEEKDDE